MKNTDTYDFLEGYIEYLLSEDIISPGQVKYARELASDYISDLQSDEMEFRASKDIPSEYFENEENDMNL